MTSRSRKQGFCDDSTKALTIKSVTMGEKGGSKIVRNCVTSFEDDPLPLKRLQPMVSSETSGWGHCWMESQTQLRGMQSPVEHLQPGSLSKKLHERSSARQVDENLQKNRTTVKLGCNEQLRAGQICSL